MKKLKICHERVLPRNESALFVADMALRATMFFKKLWINGSTLRVSFMGGTSGQISKAKEQALWWTEHANLKFDFGNDPRAEIRVGFNSRDGAWSYIGTDSQDIPFSQPTMNLGFMDGGTAAHEFGHAIGLGHEHQNPTGGLQWNEEVVLRDLSGPPNYWDAETIRHNVLDKYSVDHVRGTEYDPESIMLYFFPASWTKNGRGTKANETLSVRDIMYVASSQAYPKSTIEAVELQVGATPKQAHIGQPGEEDLFRFAAVSAGRHVIETGGQTDVMMKLFGPDSRTKLISEDDDGGVGLNARIAVNLAPGQYFVQVRHYNLLRGTGAYTVRVRK